MYHPFDLAHLIAGDHDLATVLFDRLENGEGNRQALIHQVITNVAVHAGAEEQVFYPALTNVGYKEEAEADLAQHQIVKDALIVLDRHEAGTPEAEEALRTVIDTIRQHAVEEENGQLPRLRDKVGDAEMVDLGLSFVAAERNAPTRSHPHSPSKPVLAVPAAMVDNLRDKAKGRDEEAATDASGLLAPQAQELVDTLAGLGIKPPHLLEPDAARKQPTMADAVKKLMKERHIDWPERMAGIEDATIPGPGGEIPIRVYRPFASDGAALPVLVYVHGGGWVIADMDVYDASARGLANRADCLVVSVEYRHAPEAPFPAAHDDVLAATKWVLANAAEFGGDPARVAICGESAGGNMAAATCIALANEGGPQLIFQALVYPVTSTAMDSASYAEAVDAKPLYSGWMNWFLGHTISELSDLDDIRLNLMATPIDQLSTVPPALVITAGRDPLRDEGEAFALRLEEAGVLVTATRYEGMMHEFFGAASVLDDAAAAQDEVASALAAAFSGLSMSEQRA
jgi:acetyl esterase